MKINRNILPIAALLPLSFLVVLPSPVSAQTDDDLPEQTVKRTPADEALWKKLDITEDDWLDGTELNGGWIRFDTDGDSEVTKDEWMQGRARERAKTQTPSRRVSPRKATPVVQQRQTKRFVATKPASPKAIKLAPVARRAGYIVGRAVKDNGSPVPTFTVRYSGFEDGKLANYSYGGGLYETINSSMKASGGRYAVKVPAGAYRANAYVTYRFRGRVYNFEMEPLGAEPNYDYKSLQLEKLRRGLIRNFVLKMTGKKRGASEATETVYRFAYYGGTVKLYADEYDAVFGTGAAPSKPLRYAYPEDSRILLTLTPASPRVDGSKNYPVNADLRLGDDGKWTFMVRGIFPGVYTATAKLRLPDGNIKPLRLATKGADFQFTRGADGSSGRKIFDRKSSVTVDFLPEALGPAPRMGVKEVKLYLGD